MPEKSDRGEAQGYRCPTCSVLSFSDARTAVPVWEDPEEYEAGDDPDYVGCLQCNTMQRFSEEAHV